MQRERVLDLYHDGFGHRQIAREVRSSPGFVQKVIDRYNEQNTSLRAARVCCVLGPRLPLGRTL